MKFESEFEFESNFYFMADTTYLKDLKQNELVRIAQASISSGNYITLTHIDNINKEIVNPNSSLLKDDQTLFQVCRNGNIDTLEFIKGKNVAIQKKDYQGNGCLHYAAKWGNVSV